MSDLNLSESFFFDYNCLTEKQKSVFNYLQWLSREFKLVYPSRQRIAKAVGCSVRTVDYSIERFKELGWITTKKRAYNSSFISMRKDLIWQSIMQNSRRSFKEKHELKGKYNEQNCCVKSADNLRYSCRLFATPLQRSTQYIVHILHKYVNTSDIYKKKENKEKKEQAHRSERKKCYASARTIAEVRTLINRSVLADNPIIWRLTYAGLSVNEIKTLWRSTSSWSRLKDSFDFTPWDAILSWATPPKPPAERHPAFEAIVQLYGYYINEQGKEVRLEDRNAI